MVVGGTKEVGIFGHEPVRVLGNACECGFVRDYQSDPVDLDALVDRAGENAAFALREEPSLRDHDVDADAYERVDE